MTRYRLLTALVIATTLSACTPSEVDDPNAKASLTGRLIGADGSPMPANQIQLSYQRDLVFLSNTKTEFFDDETDSSGVFRFQLRGRDLNYENVDEARDFSLLSKRPAAPGETAESTVRATFEVNRTRLPLNLKFWNPRTRMDDGVVSWEGTPSDLGSGTGYKLTIKAKQPGQHQDGTPRYLVIGSYEPSGASKVLDPRFLEDSSGVIELEAQRERRAPGSKVRMIYSYGPVEYSGTAGAPLSRGKTCYLETESLGKQPLVPCLVTDGNFANSDPRLSSETDSPGPTPSGDRWVVVDIGVRVPVDLLVIRRCNCPADVSGDGTTWIRLGTPKENILVPNAPVTARYVRVQAGFDVTEISIW